MVTVDNDSEINDLNSGDDGDDDDDDRADAWCQCVSGPGESLSIQNWPYPPTTSTRYTSLPNTQILNLKYTTIHSKCIKCIGPIPPMHLTGTSH